MTKSLIFLCNGAYLSVRIQPPLLPPPPLVILSSPHFTIRVLFPNTPPSACFLPQSHKQASDLYFFFSSSSSFLVVKPLNPRRALTLLTYHINKTNRSFFFKIKNFLGATMSRPPASPMRSTKPAKVAKLAKDVSSSPLSQPPQSPLSIDWIKRMQHANGNFLPSDIIM